MNFYPQLQSATAAVRRRRSSSASVRSSLVTPPATPPPGSRTRDYPTKIHRRRRSSTRAASLRTASVRRRRPAPTTRSTTGRRATAIRVSNCQRSLHPDTSRSASPNARLTEAARPRSVTVGEALTTSSKTIMARVKNHFYSVIHRWNILTSRLNTFTITNDGDLRRPMPGTMNREQQTSMKL